MLTQPVFHTFPPPPLGADTEHSFPAKHLERRGGWFLLLTHPHACMRSHTRAHTPRDLESSRPRVPRLAAEPAGDASSPGLQPLKRSHVKNAAAESSTRATLLFWCHNNSFPLACVLLIFPACRRSYRCCLRAGLGPRRVLCLQKIEFGMFGSHRFGAVDLPSGGFAIAVG